MGEYLLVIDTWESQGEIDESVYKQNNIAAIISRLNDMNGGHHMDEGFAKQWEESEGFLRAPYFVYNPWVDAQANFDWLVSHCPSDAHTVLIDIEVRKPDYSTRIYAQQIVIFMNLVEQRWGTKTIYTGGWFLDVLAYWPEDADYWWAQYPYALYPDSTTQMSWDDVRKILDDGGWNEPFNASQIPGVFKMWQVSGDRLILPGNHKRIDVNAFFGTMEELARWLGYPEGTQEPNDVWVSSIVGINESGEAELDTAPFSDVRVEFSDGTSDVYALAPVPEPPEPPEPEPEPEPEKPVPLYEGEVVERVNFRAGAGTQYEKTRDTLPIGTRIIADELKPVGDDEWLHIISLDGIPVDGWSAAYWNDIPLIEWHVIADEELTPEPNPNSGREDWLPDPNRPDHLYFTRDSGYKKVPVMSGKGSGTVLIEPQFSAGFLGDRIEGKWLHVIDQNGDKKDKNGNDLSGWVDYTANGMIELAEIPEEVLNSLIPPKTKEPEIFRYIEAPNDGKVYRQFVWDFHKEDHDEPQPHTVNLFTDSGGREGWVPLPRLWQWFLLDLLKLDAPGNSIAYYVSAYAGFVADNRAMTDLHDKDDHTDWILGQNISLNKPFYWKWSITMRGNMVRQLSQNGNDIYVDGLDITKDPPPAESVHSKPWFVHKANVAYPNEKRYILSNGFVKTVYFPQIKQMINGKLEKTSVSYPFFKFPYPVNRRLAKLEVFAAGIKRTIVNLSRWL